MAIVVMGPSGSGKTTTATLLARRLGWPFAEGDEFHPASNIDKMRRGIPLDDDDRAPWLIAIRDWITGEAGKGQDIVIACSALKRSYRDLLRGARADVRFVELMADPQSVAARLHSRRGHYMPASLLASQYQALEHLREDEAGIQVTTDESPATVVERALAGLSLESAV